MTHARLTRLGALLLVALLAWTSPMRAEELQVQALNAEVAVTGTVADARFAIKVANATAVAAENLWVVFADGLEVQVGDVAAGGSATSQAVTRSIDLSSEASKYVTLPVRLRYSSNGQAAEAAGTVTLEIER